MHFLKKFLARSSTKWMLIFVCFFVTVWTFFWSMQVGHFHWGPVLIGSGFISFVFGMSWLMRNNP